MFVHWREIASVKCDNANKLGRILKLLNSLLLCMSSSNLALPVGHQSTVLSGLIQIFKIYILDIHPIMIVLDLPSSNSLVVMMLSLSMVLTADNSYMNYNKIFQLQDRGNYCKYINTRFKPPSPV